MFGVFDFVHGFWCSKILCVIVVFCFYIEPITRTRHDMFVIYLRKCIQFVSTIYESVFCYSTCIGKHIIGYMNLLGLIISPSFLLPSASLPNPHTFQTMSHSTYKSGTILHLVPAPGIAKSALDHDDNAAFVSMSRKGQLGLEVGFHVARRRAPEIITSVGRDADLILSASTISGVEFTFEIHPESGAVMFCNRGSNPYTCIRPGGIRQDGKFNRLAIFPDTEYEIVTGGPRTRYAFRTVWIRDHETTTTLEVQKGYQLALGRGRIPRYAITEDEEQSDLRSWYNMRIGKPGTQYVQRVHKLNMTIPWVLEPTVSF